MRTFVIPLYYGSGSAKAKSYGSYVLVPQHWLLTANIRVYTRRSYLPTSISHPHCSQQGSGLYTNFYNFYNLLYYFWAWVRIRNSKMDPDTVPYCRRERKLVQIFPRCAGKKTDIVKLSGLTFLLNKILVKVLERGNADPDRSIPFLLLGGRFFQLIPIVLHREMENISTGPTFGDFVTILTGQHGCKTTKYKSTDSPLPPSIKCYVLRESLSEDSPYIPCAILKRKGILNISGSTIKSKIVPPATWFTFFTCKQCCGSLTFWYGSGSAGRNQGFSYFFCLMMDVSGSKSGSVQIMTDPEGPKHTDTYPQHCM